jgi:ubiquinone/menaquinone biosynthesis C-methylase UbiE
LLGALMHGYPEGAAIFRHFMGVATHLGINLKEYDLRIRTFIPDYEEMLDIAAAAIPSRSAQIVDLGIGTGALASRCLNKAPRSRIVGVDSDGEILGLAARRLGSRGSFVCGSFLRTPFPKCDAVVASFSLHHVRTARAKAKLFARARAALRPAGRFVTVDCYPAKDLDLARKQRQAWIEHLHRSYSSTEAAKLLAAWAREDSYMPLQDEINLLQQGGFRVEVLWRKESFAVLLAK